MRKVDRARDVAVGVSLRGARIDDDDLRHASLQIEMDVGRIGLHGELGREMPMRILGTDGRMLEHERMDDGARRRIGERRHDGNSLVLVGEAVRDAAGEARVRRHFGERDAAGGSAPGVSAPGFKPGFAPFTTVTGIS